jgi:hypothetical protein
MKNLPKWKRNDIFRAIEASGLSPEAFTWDDGTDDLCLRHRSSAAYFVFAGTPGEYVARYVSGDDSVTELTAYSWSKHLERFGRWAVAVKNDMETPDLWAELLQQTQLLGSASDDGLENTPFTPDERAEVARQLNEFRQRAKAEYSLSATQSEDLDSKVDYLVDAADRLGRKDWLNACMGALVGYFLATALSPDASRKIFLMLLDNVAGFFGHGLRGLGIG